MLERVKLYLLRNKKMTLGLTLMVFLVSLSLGVGLGLNRFTNDLGGKELQGLEAIAIKNLEDMTRTMLLVIVLSSLLILSLMFIYWVRGRKKEVGILLAVGISKRSIFTQFFLEILILSILSVSLSILPAQWLAKTMSESTTESVTEDAKYSQEANEKGVAGEALDLETFKGFSVRDISVIYLISVSLVIITSMGTLLSFIHKKPRVIIQEVS